MRFWIVVGCSVLVLAAAIWPFGSKSVPQPTFPPVAISTQPPAESPKPAPPKVIETIDLSRAYDPAREEEPISPATFIEIVPEPERLDVMPREVPDDPCWNTLEGIRQSSWPLGEFQPTGMHGGLLSFVPSHDAAAVRVQPPIGLDIGTFELIPESASSPERLDVMPREVEDDPYRDLLDQIHNAPAGAATPASANPLTVMPREVVAVFVPTPNMKAGEWKFVSVEHNAPAPRVLPSRFAVAQPDGKLLHYVETDTGIVRVPHGGSPAADKLTHPIPRAAFKVPLIPVEYVTAEPRPDGIRICAEERERETNLREDDFTAP